MGEERRLEDKWRVEMEAKVTSLQEGQTSIQSTLDRNNEMTETLLMMFNGTQNFWRFCTKVSKFFMWLITKGTVIAAFVIGAYHAIDAIASHDIASSFREWWRK